MLVTVPLSVLQKDAIEFVPHLPVEKTKAIKSLGAGVIEMVSLENWRFFLCFLQSRWVGAESF